MSSIAAVGSPMLHEDVEMPLAEEEDVMMVDAETQTVADVETQTVADAETQTETEAAAETQENENDASVHVHVQNDFQHYDSKKETGYVGLKNHGATCYMNSLLQTLFHIPYFRKAVYEMPTTENDIVACTIPLALQRLFYRLQYSNKRVSTKGLTRSFGWNAYDLFMQHDVQELNRVLVEKMENKMKGTLVEGTVQQLFEGHHMSYVECINVDYKSTRRESYYDLQLDVKGCQDVYESFDKYVEVENLDGENKYRAEQHGLQDAKKGVLFLDFPPVLQLHLKRFEYDFMRDAMIKINDRYEFPLQLDLDKDNCKYLSPDADKSVHNLYTLHSVLVHTGGGHGGHYYAFIRPTLSDQWYKFDDERVTKEDMKQALEELFGGEDETNPGDKYAPCKSIKCSNAYMLVYIRESDKDKIICKADEMDIAAHLRIKLRKEQEEKELRRKERAEANLYTLMRIARENDLAQQIGRDVIFDLVDYDKVECFHVFKTKLFVIFREELSQKYNIPVQCQRFWVWAKRKNRTCRLSRPLLLHEEFQPVGYLEEMFSKTSARELRLFLEVNSNMGHRLFQPEKTKEEILLCFKFYDPEKEKISYAGMAIVSALSKPLDYLSKLKDMVGFSLEEEVVLYEEIQVEPLVTLDRINVNITFHDNQLKDGDIICFQKDYSSEDVQQRFPDIPSFFNYISNRQIVGFRSLEKPKEDEFYLELSKLDDYIEVVGKVAQKIGIDDISRIRLTSHNCCTNSPNSHPIKYRVDYHLVQMLIHYNQSSEILYYEVLDIPLPEFQALKSLQLYFYNPTVQVASEIMLHLPKQSTFQDVVNELRAKVELRDPNVAIRVIELFDHRICKIFPPNEKIENVNDQHWTLRAEEVPEEEQNLGAQDRLIRVYHFNRAASESINYFGEPFLLAIHEGETLADIKVRIKEKLLVSDEEFSKWKFAFFSTGCPGYLQDSDVLSIHFQRDIYGGWEHYLGLEHTDNSQKKSQVNQSRHVSEKPVKIYN